MANEAIIVTYLIPTVIIGMLCNFFNTDNVSKAIIMGLMGFFSNSLFGKKMNDFALHQITTIEERKDMKSYSFRISCELKTCTGRYSVVDTQYNIITIMLANFLYYSGAAAQLNVVALNSSPELNMVSMPTETEVDESLRLVKLMGNKWSSMMQYAIKRIAETSSKSWVTSVDVFAGALGIFSNIRYAFNEVINDIDLWKINLYKVIKEAKDEVLIGMRAKSLGKEIFEESKDSMKKGLELNKKKANKKAAIDFLYANILSTRGRCNSYKAISMKSYNKKIDAIYPLHERLKNAEIHGLHAFDIIKKYKKEENVIFIIAPPYLDKNVYEKDIVIDKKYGEEKKKFGYSEHMELAKLLRETHQKHGNDFIFFCRITVTREENQETKEITNIDELETGDRHMHGRIDDLYWGYGFYYIDIPYDNDGTIERIITSFDFDGAKPYGASVSHPAETEVES